MTLLKYIPYLALLIFIGAVVLHYKLNERTLHDQISKLEKVNTSYHTDLLSCESKLSFQNQRIEEMKAHADRAEAELTRWRSKPPEVRYEPIYRYLPSDINFSKKDCNETIRLLDSLEYLDLDTL